MRIQLVVGFALAAIGVSAYGCSSASNPYPDVNAYCEAYAKSICKVSSVCGFDATACQTYQNTQCLSAVPTGGSRQYSSSNVPDCLKAVDGAYGQNASSISAATLANVNKVCQRVFVGTAGNGSPCTSDYDCSVSTQVCSAPAGKSAQCATPTSRVLGDDCGDHGDQCTGGTYCSPTSGKCEAGAATGVSCATIPCDSNSHCVNGTCEALATLQQNCCTSSDCASGLFCDTYVNSAAPVAQCEASLTFGGRGDVDCPGIGGQASIYTCPAGGSSSGGGDAGSDGGDAGTGDAGTGDAAGD